MNKEITENNKLIAEFIGATMNKGGEYEMYQVLDHLEDTPASKHFYFQKEMEFHSSWDWLMPVVEKCSVLEDENVGLIGGITNRLHDLMITFYSVSIDLTYEAVVEFIKWYNENKS